MRRRNKDIDNLEVNPLEKAVADYLSIYSGMPLAEDLIVITENLLVLRLKDVSEYMEAEEITEVVLKMGNSIRAAWLRRQTEPLRKAFAKQFTLNILLKNGLQKTTEDDGLEKIRKRFAEESREAIAVIDELDYQENKPAKMEIILPENWLDRPQGFRIQVIENKLGKAVDEMINCLNSLLKNEHGTRLLRRELTKRLAELNQKELNDADTILDVMLEIVKIFFNKVDLGDLYKLLAKKDAKNFGK